MSTITPTPPGKLGQAARPADMLAYLGALDAWLTGRRAELDGLDAEIVSAGRQELTADLALALALWQAVKTRQNLLLSTWDSGRVGQAELDRMSTLIWGGLDTGGQASPAGSLAVCLPEASRLCDALTSQLRTALNTDPGIEEQLNRLRALRAQFERIRDQAGLEPPALRPAALARLDTLAARADEAAAKRERGGDVGGLLGPLENDAAIMERDLIVTAARRHEAHDLLTRVRDARAQLLAREQAVRALAEQATAAVWPCPPAEIPDVAALGPVPNTGDALRTYADQLNRIRSELATAQEAFSAPLAERQKNAALLSALMAKATALGAAGDPTLAALRQAAAALLDCAPTVLPALEHVLAAVNAVLERQRSPR